ncbi:MAG: c-type cytochrome [Thiotrichales bacterium]
MKHVRIRAVILILSVALGAAPAVAEPEPESVIKYRQAFMKALGGHSGAVSQIVRGGFAPDGHLLVHARAIAGLSQGLLAVFPEGSDFGETRAKPEIWARWTQFKKIGEDGAAAGAELLRAVERGDAAEVADRYARLGETCKACHKDFRAEE